jgi:hypothetical protein
LDLVHPRRGGRGTRLRRLACWTRSPDSASWSPCTATFVVTLTGRDRELEKESDRLLALFNYVREQAELQTRQYGVMFQDDGYEFLTYDVHRGVWRSVGEDDALNARRLPAGLGFQLIVDARPVVLKRPKDAKDKTPQVMIFSNGDLSGFAATLERDSGLRSVTITEDDKGEVIEQPMVEQKP